MSDKIKEIKDRVSEVVHCFSIPWRWNQPRGFGARMFLWDNNSSPWQPITQIDQSFPFADFVANAPSDILYLLSEIERLKKANESLIKEVMHVEDINEPKKEWLKDCGGISLRCGVCERCREIKKNERT